jgi:hypothetical protein
LSQICSDFDQAIFPEFRGQRRSSRRARELAIELAGAVEHATPDTIKGWMHDEIGSYPDDRQDLVNGGIELAQNRDDVRGALDALYQLLHRRTGDPMFLVPGVYWAIIEGKTEDKTMSKQITAIAHALPLDDTPLGLLAQALPDAHSQLKEQALLLALEAIDQRRAKKLYNLPPYNRDSLKDSYLWILELLCSLYEDTNQMDKLRLYQARYLKIADDTSLARVPAPSQPAPNDLASLPEPPFPSDLEEDEAIKNHPAVRYYEWFKTLGIDLSSGDGSVTKISAYDNTSSGQPRKIGRNDPCPCGATKSDGTPLKYKKCHGASV